MTQPFLKPKPWLPVLCFFALALTWDGCRGPEAAYSEIPGAARSPCVYPSELVRLYFGGGLHQSVYEQKINDDGTLRLSEIGVVIVTNKSVGELQKELTALYRKYYKNLEVLVVPMGRVYYVGGEVKSRGAKEYLGKTTVSTAIQAAGDFTEAANKKKVKLIRSDGRSASVVVVDLRKAIQPPNDPQVYPGDKIDVPRKWWH